MCLNWGVKT